MGIQAFRTQPLFLAAGAVGVGWLLVVAALWIFFVVRRVRGRRVRPGLSVVPLALILGGGIALLTNRPSDVTGMDVALALTGCALSFALGIARGLTVDLSLHDRGLWFRYTAVTVLLWLVLLAARLGFRLVASAHEASSSTTIALLILMLGITLLAETVIIARRARRYLTANAPEAWHTWQERRAGRRRWSSGLRRP